MDEGNGVLGIVWGCLLGAFGWFVIFLIWYFLIH